VELDALLSLRRQFRQDPLAEGAKHGAANLMHQIPLIGLIWATLLMARCFCAKRQPPAYFNCPAICPKPGRIRAAVISRIAWNFYCDFMAK
jgi:hypothetical protein